MFEGKQTGRFHRSQPQTDTLGMHPKKCDSDRSHSSILLTKPRSRTQYSQRTEVIQTRVTRRILRDHPVKVAKPLDRASSLGECEPLTFVSTHRDTHDVLIDLLNHL